jgi:hypothetical protein
MNDAQRKSIDRAIRFYEGIDDGAEVAAALRALLAQSTPPPREPTEAMARAGGLVADAWADGVAEFEDIWRTMHDAATGRA